MKTYKIIDLLDDVISGEWGKEPNGNNDVKVIRTTNFTNIGQINLDKGVVSRHIEEKKVEKKKLKYGDIIIEKSGGSPDQPVGRVVYYNIEDENTYLCNNFTSVLRPDNGKVENKYLFYYLFFHHKIRTVLKYQNKTTGIINLKLDNYLKNVEIKVPELEIQQKIIMLLDTARELIEKRKAQIETLTLLAQSVFLQMFGDINTNNKKWDKVKLNDLLNDKNSLVDGPFGSSVNTKTDYVDDGEIPVIRTKNVGLLNFIENDLKFMSEENFKKIDRSEVLPGDIVLTKVGTIGNICIFPNTFHRAVLSTTGSCRIRINEKKINKKFLVYYLLYYRPKMAEIASQGVQAFLNLNHIRNFDIFLPDEELQSRFEIYINNIEDNKKLFQKSLIELEYLFEAMIHRAFNDQIFISSLDFA